MQLTELERLAREATPGPWEAYTECTGECCWMIRQPESDDVETEGVTWPETGREDAAYIAAANPATMLKLLEVVKAAKAVAYSNGFDAALPEKKEALSAALRALVV